MNSGVSKEFSGANVEREFAKRVSKIKGVRDVYFKSEQDQTVRLWTVVNSEDFSVRSRVYEVEGEIYDLYPDAVFDFYVVIWPRLKNATLDGVIPSGFAPLLKR